MAKPKVVLGAGSVGKIAPELGLIPCGPMVRRAEPSEVWFWFACSEEVLGCKARIFTDFGDLTLSSDSTFKSMRIGERLWVVLVSAKPGSGAFASDAILQYDLELSLAGGLTAKVSENVLGLAYEPYKFPAFMLGNEHRRVVHGSCRRIGADGPDAFLAYDTWFAEQAASPADRVCALFLTGDQIYADDLAEPLFASVQRLALDLFGYYEYFPSGAEEPTVSTNWQGIYTENPPDFPPSRKWLTSLGHSEFFTTDDGEGHCISLPEYVALYVMGWNPQICAEYLSEKDQSGYFKNENYPMAGFTKAAGAARRVLANTVSYMILDDHDVTDDWNLDQSWATRTTQSPMGRRIIANALGAAFAFQTWGNDPTKYDDAFIKTLTDHLSEIRSQKGLPGDAADKFDKLLLERHWAFVAPTTQPVLCVDTRTLRQFQSGETSILSGPNTWPGLKKLGLERELVVNQNLVIVLATPLLCHYAAVWGQNYKFGNWKDPTSDKYDIYDKYKGDWELYPDYPLQGYELIRFLHDWLNPNTTIIFSGDVHHGFVIDGMYGQAADYKDVNAGKADWTMRVVQITSSPIKNMSKDKFVDNFHWGWGDVIDLPVSEGRMGQAFKALWLTGNTPTSALQQIDGAGNVSKIGDGKSMAMRSNVVHLKGPLGHESFVFENHLCVVDLPVVPGENVTSTFIGASYLYNEVVANTPGGRETLNAANYPGKLATSTCDVSTTNGPELFKVGEWLVGDQFVDTFTLEIGEKLVPDGFALP